MGIQYRVCTTCDEPKHCIRCDLESHLSKFTKTARKHISGLISLYDCECPPPPSGSESCSDSYLPHIDDMEADDEVLDQIYAEYKRERKEHKNLVEELNNNPNLEKLDDIAVSVC